MRKQSVCLSMILGLLLMTSIASAGVCKIPPTPVTGLAWKIVNYPILWTADETVSGGSIVFYILNGYDFFVEIDYALDYDSNSFPDIQKTGTMLRIGPCDVHRLNVFGFNARNVSITRAVRANQ